MIYNNKHPYFSHFSTPKVPKIDSLENFTGKIFHSHDYRNPEMLRDKSVLILGAGPSGSDIALEAAKVSSQVG